jgi:hypothetical protein
MANLLVAGNSSNGGTAITTDTSGTLNIVTGSGSGSNAITIDASQNVAMTASQTIAGNLTVTGTLTASGGVSGSITSGTAVTASGTSVSFTSIPSTVKRITVMFNQISTNGTSHYLIQIGSGSFTTTGYLGATTAASTGVGTVAVTTGFGVYNNNGAANVIQGNVQITSFGSNIWTASGAVGNSNAAVTAYTGGVSSALSGALDRIRITTVNGTDTFDAGTINILFE